MMTLKLRAYQRTAIDAIQQDWQEGYTDVLLTTRIDPRPSTRISPAALRTASPVLAAPPVTRRHRDGASE